MRRPTSIASPAKGRWKLHHQYDGNRFRLFDVAADPGEVIDRSSDQPALVADLERLLTTWRATVGAIGPTPNPHYEAMRSGAMPRPDGNGRLPRP